MGEVTDEPITLALTRHQWRDVYLALDSQWQETRDAIAEQCKGTGEWLTVTLTETAAWQLTEAIRPTQPELADRLEALMRTILEPW